MKIPSIPVPNVLLIKHDNLDLVKRDEIIYQQASVTSSDSMKSSIKSTLSIGSKSKQKVIVDECLDEESDNEHFFCSSKSILSQNDEENCIESYCHHEIGSLNLLDACIKSYHHQSSAQDNNKKNSGTRKTRRASFSSDFKEFDDSMILPHETEDVSIHDIARSIINSTESWEEMRKQIRAKKLVTSLGVFETCQSLFEEEAYKLKKKRIEEARLERARLSTLTRFRRRLSLF